MLDWHLKDQSSIMLTKASEFLEQTQNSSIRLRNIRKVNAVFQSQIRQLESRTNYFLRVKEELLVANRADSLKQSRNKGISLVKRQKSALIGQLQNQLKLEAEQRKQQVSDARANNLFRKQLAASLNKSIKRNRGSSVRLMSQQSEMLSKKRDQSQNLENKERVRTVKQEMGKRVGLFDLKLDYLRRQALQQAVRTEQQNYGAVSKLQSLWARVRRQQEDNLILRRLREQKRSSA